MRRTLWNIYAWPITLLLVIILFPLGDRDRLLSSLDLLMSLPSLIALHLHIWDKKIWPNQFWKLYAFGFIVWELLYNLILEPMDTGKPFDPVLFIALVFLRPLYVALFRYAFRNWDEGEFPQPTWKRGTTPTNN
jgi:hypothetical protein